MGRYHYTKSEKEFNKVLKYQQDELANIDQQISEMSSSCDTRISESASLLKSLGYETKYLSPIQSTEPPKTTPILTMENWEDIVQEAEDRYPYNVELEDILSQPEFENAYQNLENINREFRCCTALDGIDLSIMIIAAALQTLRWALMPEIGKTIDKATRITADEGDEIVKRLKNEFIEKHGNWTAEKKQQGRRLREQEGKTWKEIIFFRRSL